MTMMRWVVMRWVGCLAVLQASGAGALLVSPTTPPAHSAPRCTPTGKQAVGGTVIALNKATVNVMKGAIDVIYAGRDFQRFYVLETIARAHVWILCFHLTNDARLAPCASHASWSRE